MKAIWNGKVIAESNDTVNLKGNSYFPREAVNNDYMKQTKPIRFVPGKVLLCNTI